MSLESYHAERPPDSPGVGGRAPGPHNLLEALLSTPEHCQRANSVRQRFRILRSIGSAFFVNLYMGGALWRTGGRKGAEQHRPRTMRRSTSASKSWPHSRPALDPDESMAIANKKVLMRVTTLLFNYGHLRRPCPEAPVATLKVGEGFLKGLSSSQDQRASADVLLVRSAEAGQQMPTVI